jgi:hypothetical protein
MRAADEHHGPIRTESLDQYLTMLIYLRDAAGLSAPADYPLPPLAPAVPLHAALAPAATADASEAWGRRWAESFGSGRRSRLGRLGPGSLEPPEPGTDLRALFDGVVDEAHDWSRQRVARFHERRLRSRRGGSTAGETVRRIQRELGRPSAPFSLDVLIVPLERAWGRRMNEDVVVVSDLLWFDEDGYDLFLDRVLRTLM